MDPIQLRKIILRWAPPILILALIGAAVAFVLTRNETPQYQATGRVVVLGQVQSSALTLTPDEIIATDAALMTEPSLLRQVISDLHLPLSEDQLAAEIVVAQEAKTELIDVTVTDADPARAAQIANAVMSTFVSGAQAQTTSGQQQAVAILQPQVAAAKVQVQLDQTALDSATRNKSGVAAAQAQFDADNARLVQLTTQLTQLTAPTVQGGKAIDVASAATAPTSALTGHKRTATALGAFGGLLLGIALAIALQYLDQGLNSEEDVRNRLGLPTLGMVPVYRPGLLKRNKEQRDSTAAGEAYRRLRTSLLFSSLDNPLRSIVLTSARAGEGKSRTAANLAGVMAAAGERVLLVDADMRRPSQHRIFGEKLGDGISELLLQAAHITTPSLNGQHHTHYENLSLLTAGTIPPNPSELLASKTTAGVFRRLEQQFDLVIIDTPPAQVVTDALSLAASTTGTILVIEAGKTNAQQAMRTIESLRAVGANVVGAVLNKVRRRALSAYASYYYYYANAAVAQDSEPGVAGAVDDTPVQAWTPVGDPNPHAGAHRP